MMHRSGVTMAWNVFKFCTALRGLGSLMILLVLGIIGVSYYAVVVANYGPSLIHAGGLDALVAFVVLLLFHALACRRWRCFFGAISLLSLMILGVSLLIGGLQLMKREEKALP